MAAQALLAVERWREGRTRKPFTSRGLYNFEPIGVPMDPRLFICKSAAVERRDPAQVRFPVKQTLEMGTGVQRFIWEFPRVSACRRKRRAIRQTVKYARDAQQGS